MTPAGEARLRSHAASLVATAGVPRQEVDGLIEEMLGHLVETVERNVAAGTDEGAAVAAAIAAFGARETVGHELARTYHSALWAATVGVLLSARDGETVQPGAIGALRLLVAVVFTLTLVVEVPGVLALTPVAAVAVGIASGAFLAISVLAFRALALGQVWALRFAVGVAGVALILGLRQIADAPPDTIFIPLLAIAAGACLAWVVASERRVSAFVAGSRPIGRVLGVVVGAALLAPTLVSAALPAIHDPTQAGPGDVAMTISMACRIGPELPSGDAVADARPTAILTAELAWSRADVLPRGLAGLLGRDDANDTAGFRVIDPAPIPIDGGGGFPTWLLELENPTVIDVQSGETVGWFGSSSPSVERIPDTIGSFTVGIDNNRIRAGRTIRIVWALVPTQDGPTAWPRAEVAYAHLDRFVLIGRVGCGEHAVATAGTVPASAQPRFLP
ncbi:MAG: hypothetical protein QOE42_2241 [Chloroflexota bacterium]|nr:hypothetical protein [Chloroflexota bacterium]